MKEPSLGIKSNQERTWLPCIVYFELNFAKNLPSTSAFSESFCQKFQGFQKALRKGSFNWYKSEALIIPRKKIPERLPRSTYTFVTRQTSVKSNGKVVKNGVGRITVFTLLRSVIGQHKTPSLFFFYRDTCGSPVLCFLSPFFSSATKWKNCAIVPSGQKMEKKTMKQNNVAYTSSIQRIQETLL